MMLGVFLFALFSTVAVAAVAVLADCYIRGRDAFTRLRRELEWAERGYRVSVRIEDVAKDERCPAPHAQIIRRSDPRRCATKRGAALAPQLAAAA